MTACTAAAPTDIVVLRHGQSEANAKGIIASQFATAGRAYGLTENGRRQAEQSAKAILAQFPDRDFVIVTSPLLRTQQTAAIAEAVFGPNLKASLSDSRFIERDFSFFETQSDDHYEDVWAIDARGMTVASQFNHKVEELVSVRDRTQDALRDAQREFPGAVIVIVTHGDVASNIITVDKGIGLKQHREVGALPTAGYYTLQRR